MQVVRQVDTYLGEPPVTVWAGRILLGAFPSTAAWRILEEGVEQGDLVVYSRLNGAQLRRFKRGDWNLVKYGLD